MTQTCSPKISVLVVALNEEQRLPLLLSSLGQRSLDQVELIMIDNGSQDKTFDLMCSYSKSTRNAYVYQFVGALGAAFNFGLRTATGRYVVFMGADMAFPPHWLSTICQIMNTDTLFDALVARLIPLFRYQGSLNDYVLGYFLGDTAAEGEWKEQTFHSGGLVVKRDSAVRIGFNTALPTAEDGDFSYRFLRHGYKARYSPFKYFVLDEQYCDLSGLISYFRKLGVGATTLVRLHPSLGMSVTFLRTLFEPLTPHYLLLRYRKAACHVRIGYFTWVLAGFTRLLAMVYATVVYGLFARPLPKKLTRNKPALL